MGVLAQSAAVDPNRVIHYNFINLSNDGNYISINGVIQHLEGGSILSSLNQALKIIIVDTTIDSVGIR